ncbi:MAG: hypothetical protein HY810_06230 [Candidatus Omnitrophica bacterium]|nr:hypothetical protein [Candidatus Omnitrophota bacterium]
MKNKKEIIIAVTAGISAYKSCELVRSLTKKGYGVTVLMSRDATHFVGALTFRTLTNRLVITDMFSDEFEWDPAHISLAQRADIVAVVPATANMIAKLANGICDDIISCVIMATKAPVLVCPAMNDNMYNHPAFKANIEKIKEFGYKVVPAIEGDLACGKKAVGHLADLGTISSLIEKLLK